MNVDNCDFKFYRISSNFVRVITQLFTYAVHGN